MKPTVSLIDDEASVLDAVGMLLSTKDYAVACYRDARSFLSAPFAAGCIVSDVRMPETTGLDLLRILQTSKDTRPLILLTGHGDVEMAVQAIKLGAYDFIEKPFSNDRLLSSVAAALVVAESSREETLHQQELRERYNSLSERQRDTMRLLIRGLANKEIAQQLGISPRTVEIHRTWVMTKMSAKTLVDLVRMGMALGIT
jgi:two-component system, LuxR family, response regulator FixJ